MQTLWQDLRYSARMLGKKPGFTLIVVLTLSLGIGANTALFSLVDKLLVQSLPVQEPAALVQLKAECVNPPLTFNEFSWADFLDYRARNQVFTELTAFQPTTVKLGEGDQLEHVGAELVAENYFALLGVLPAIGRSFLPEENREPGGHPVAVLSYSLWQSRFGGRADVLGQTVTLNEIQYNIVGIVPASFRGVRVEAPTDVWVPAMMVAQILQKKPQEEWRTDRGFTIWRLLGRLKPGVTQAAAQTAMDALALQVRDSWMPVSDRHLPFNERHVQLESAGRGLSSLRGEMGELLKLLFGIVGVILLIACANVANLLLARAATRRKEVAVRLALGAGRWRLVRQFLTESLLLACLGGLAGAWLAPWLTDLLLAFQSGTENIALGRMLNWRVAGFAFGLSLLTGVLFGLVPALQASQPDLVPALKEEGAMQADGKGFKWSRRSLIVVQVALSLVVLIAAGLFVHSLNNLFAIDPGFRSENVLVADIELPETRYDAKSAEPFFQQLRERLQGLPGVQSVAMAAHTPLSGAVGLTTVVIEGQPGASKEMPTVDMNRVSAGYHELMGIALRQGRSFSEQDRLGQPAVVTVNDAFANKFFPQQNAVGRRISLGTGMPWLTIVGVTGNVKTLHLMSKDRAQIELPLAQQNISLHQCVLVRTQADAASLLPLVRREVRELDPALAFFKATTLAGDLRAKLASWRMAATLTSLFGVVALLLAAVGLYGVIAYAVHQQTREIGIRMALGAQASDVLRLVLREGVLLISAGLVLGLAGAFAAKRLIEGFLYGVQSYDPLTFVGIGLLLTLVAFLACWIPARRAAKVDPIVALRCE